MRRCSHKWRRRTAVQGRNATSLVLCLAFRALTHKITMCVLQVVVQTGVDEFCLHHLRDVTVSSAFLPPDVALVCCIDFCHSSSRAIWRITGAVSHIQWWTKSCVCNASTFAAVIVLIMEAVIIVTPLKHRRIRRESATYLLLTLHVTPLAQVCLYYWWS